MREGRKGRLTDSFFCSCGSIRLERETGKRGEYSPCSINEDGRERGREKKTKMTIFGGGERITLEATIGITYHHIAKRDLTKPQKKEKNRRDRETTRKTTDIQTVETMELLRSAHRLVFLTLVLFLVAKKSMGKEFR